MLPPMRYILVAAAVALGLGAPIGCKTAKPAAVVTAIQGNLTGLQLLEKQLLELVPADAQPIDFSKLGGEGGDTPVLYRPRDGWRIILRTYQLRAASLVAWSKNETFDTNAGFVALVLPAITQAKAAPTPAPDTESD